MKVAIDELRRIALAALSRQGYDEHESDRILEVLMYAQLRGNNQGVVKLIGRGIPKSPDAGEALLTRETPVSAIYDAHHVHPMVVVTQAAELAIAKAQKLGVGVVGINHLNTSSGAIGYYARRIADQGLVGVVMSAGPEAVAPAGSTQAVFGTNPLAIAVPGKGGSVVLDFTTAAMALYGIMEAKAAGQSLPDGVGYDAAGKPSNDPAEVLAGAVRTFDSGPRSSGLSFMIKVLAGPLAGAGSGEMTGNWGHLVLAIDPEVLGGTEALREGVQRIVAKVMAARPAKGVEEVLVPGERGDRMTAEALASGELEIEDNLLGQLKVAAGE